MTRLETMKARFLAEPTIISQLPITLPNGCEVSEINGSCAECGNALTDEQLHGNVSRPMSNVVSFDAHGVCASCITIFPLHGRVRAIGDEMRMEWIKNGQWVGANLESETILSKLILWLKRQLRTLVN
tara:strand:+ start:593 stop:976 length:384 start_codon:yes stop_codon:yes gene_type:complete